MGKNYVERYIEYKKQLIILVSGLPGCGKNTLTKNIAGDFKLTILDQKDYYLLDYNEKRKLPNDVEVINWYQDGSIDWKKLNQDVNKHKDKGVILTGLALIEEKLEFDADFHLHLSISKKKCMEKRTVYFTKNKDQFKTDFELIGSATEKLLMNQMLFPYYLETIKRSKIDKFINGNELSSEQIYDKAFSYLIEYRIHNYLHKERFKQKILDGSLSPYKVDNLPENYPDESDTSEILSFSEPLELDMTAKPVDVSGKDKEDSDKDKIKIPKMDSEIPIKKDNDGRIQIPVLSESDKNDTPVTTEETPLAYKEESSEEVDKLKESSSEDSEY